MSCATPAAQLTFHPDNSVGANHFLGLDCSSQAKLGFEKLGNEHVQSTIRRHVLDRHAPGLAQPVSAVIGLKMIGRNPIEVLKYHMGCGRERDANGSGDDVANRYPHLSVALKPIDGLHTLLGIVGP